MIWYLGGCMEWEFNPNDWNEDELTNGSYCTFVYLMLFDDGYFYVGKKNIYRGIKDAKNIKKTTKESNWREYESSSKTVQTRIAQGYAYRKIILWAYTTCNEATFTESMLIGETCRSSYRLNKAVMEKYRIEKIKPRTMIVLDYLKETYINGR